MMLPLGAHDVTPIHSAGTGLKPVHVGEDSGTFRLSPLRSGNVFPAGLRIIPLFSI